jgi:hypothetical protein
LFVWSSVQSAANAEWFTKSASVTVRPALRNVVPTVMSSK